MRLPYRIAAVVLALAVLWGAKSAYDHGVAERALAKARLAKLEQVADSLKIAERFALHRAAVAADSARKAAIAADSARAALRRALARPVRVVRVPVDTGAGVDTVEMVPKQNYDDLVVSVSAQARADSIALAREQAAHAATRLLLATVRAERDNLADINRALRRQIPSAGDKLVTRAKWALVGAAVLATVQAAK